MVTAITWPVELGQAVIVNPSMSNDFNVIRSPMGVGPAKTRRRSTSTIKQFSCTFILKNQTEYARFLQFIESDTSGCSASFNWKDPHTGAAAELRFLSMGQIVHMGGNVFQVDFVLEKLA
jgi:hypothetical protein